MAPPSKKSNSTNFKNFQRPFNNQAKSKSDDSSLQLPLQAKDDVPDFPRGDRGSLREEVRAIVDNEFNGDKQLLKRRKKDKRGVHNKNTSTEDDMGLLFGDGIVGKFPRFANKITLKVDKERNCVSLGMKNSHFEDAKVLQTPPSLNNYFVNGNNDSVVSAKPTVLPERSSTLKESKDNDSKNHHILAGAESRALVPTLDVPLEDMESLDNEGDDGQCVLNVSNADVTGENNRKKAKKKAREEKELEISAAEERLLEKDIPRNEEEFEKLIRSSPNSSFLWIKYMAFMLSLANVDKARSIAERALRTINLREESEKLNIWVAYFNLENEYGNPHEEAVSKIFQRALQFCDPKKVHLALLGMYERTEQHKLADELIDKMCRKLKRSCKVWLRRIQFVLKQNSDGVQGVVKRGLLSLPKHKHVKFITQAGLLEFKYGVPDRGRSMFEGMLREYPKRTDLWSIYLDQEIRVGDVDAIRALFERAISLRVPPNKMKFLFKRYLEFEKRVGDAERVESVKKAAMEFVENSLA